MLIACGVEGLMLVTVLLFETELMKTQLLEIFWSAFNSYERPRQNFSSQYQYNIKQTSDENNEKLLVDSIPNSPN